MNVTKQLGLHTPRQEDLYDIGLFNENMEKIEAFLLQLQKQQKKQLIATFTESGTFRPADHGLGPGDLIDAYLVGGGGAGGATGASAGGGGGYCRLLENIVIAQETYPIVVGAGGSPGVPGGNGTPGGTTIAFEDRLEGGRAANWNYGGAGGSGGAGAAGGIGGAFGGGGSSGTVGGQTARGGLGGGNMEFTPVNPYDQIAYGCGGGTRGMSPIVFFPGGGASGAAGAGANGDAFLGGGGSATAGATGHGGLGGGGGAGTAIPTRGGGGIVYIYAAPPMAIARGLSAPVAGLQKHKISFEKMCQIEQENCKKKIGIMQDGLCIDAAVFPSLKEAKAFFDQGLWPQADGVLKLPEGYGIGDRYVGKKWVKQVEKEVEEMLEVLEEISTEPWGMP